MKIITRRTSLLAGASLALALCLGYTVPAYAGTVTVHVQDSLGNPIAGVQAQYYQSGWHNFPALTDVGGNASQAFAPDLITDFQIFYEAGSKKWQNVNTANSPTLTAATVPVTVTLKTCGGTPLVGEAYQYVSGQKDIGPTPAVKQVLPGGPYTFYVKYNNRMLSTGQTIDPVATPVVAFTTTKVTLNYSGSIFYYNGGWQTFTSPMELLPTGTLPSSFGTTDFKFGSQSAPTVTLTISGCSLVKSYVQIRLISSTGAGIVGGTVYYFNGGSSYPNLPGATDANGNLYALIDGSANREWHMTSAYLSTARQQDAGLGPVVFQTKLITVELRDSSGALMDSGTSVTYWGAGADRTFGTGITSGGKVTMELLPMNIQFNMTYLWTRGVVGPQNVVANPTVTFLTGKVVSAGGTCTGYWMSGDNRTFTSGMELFPANYEFHFSDAPTAQNFTITAGIVNTIR